MALPTLAELLVEYERARAHTRELYVDLTPEQIGWRPHEQASAIGWHLGHQAAVAHYMVRNLTAAEPSLDPDLERLMDSATAEVDRGALPTVERLVEYRETVAERVRYRIGAIEAGDVGAPAQLRVIAGTLLAAIINHEYQHDQWIAEVRTEAHGHPLPPTPSSPWLTTIDGYLVVTAT